MSASEVLKRKKPRTRKVEIAMDDSQLQRRDELIASIAREKRLESWADGGDMASPIPALQSDLREVLGQIEDDVVVFEFGAMSRNDWNAAVEKYKDEDDALTEEFEIFIVAKSSQGENKMTVKQVEKMYSSGDWSAAETELLWTAAYSVNREARDIPFTPAGIEAILSTGSNLTTAEDED